MKHPAADNKNKGLETAFDIAVYALILALFTALYAYPLSGVISVFLLLPLLYFLYQRHGVFLPSAICFLYALISILTNYTLILYIVLPVLFCAFAGLLTALKYNNYILGFSIAAAAALLGGVFGLIFLIAGEGQRLDQTAYNYVINNAADPLISYWSKRAYEDAEFSYDFTKLDPDDPNYEREANEHFANLVKSDTAAYSLYYVVHLCVLPAGCAYLAALYISKKFPRSRYIKINPPDAPFRDMRIKRYYIWTVLLPVGAVCILMSLFKSAASMGATLMHLFITLPGAFNFFTLSVYFVCLLKRYKIWYSVAAAICVTIAALCLIFPLALLITSFIGLADVVLNLRYWTDYIISDEE